VDRPEGRLHSNQLSVSSSQSGSIFERFAEAFPLVSDENQRWAKEGPFLTSLVQQSGECKGRVLDLACGSGFHSRHLASEGFEVCGLEISAGAIRKGKALPGGGKVAWVQGDIRRPYPGIFDIVLLVGNTLSLFHDKDGVRRVFRNASDALVHKGVFLIHVIDFAYLERNPLKIERAGQVHDEEATFKKTIRRTRGGALIHIKVTLNRESGPYTEEGTQRLTTHTPGFLRQCASEHHMRLMEEVAGFDGLKRARGQTKDRLFAFERLRSGTEIEPPLPG
jgi:SAM-dependent methyltransferase